MGKAKKFKLLRKALKAQFPKVPFSEINSHYKKMKKVVLGL